MIRLITAAAKQQGSRRVIPLRGKDRVGLLQAWSAAVAERDINILISTVAALDGQAIGIFVLDNATDQQVQEIKDDVGKARKHLARIDGRSQRQRGGSEQDTTAVLCVPLAAAWR